jgi:hypothetical protein
MPFTKEINARDHTRAKWDNSSETQCSGLKFGTIVFFSYVWYLKFMLFTIRVFEIFD